MADYTKPKVTIDLEEYNELLKSTYDEILLFKEIKDKSFLEKLIKVDLDINETIHKFSLVIGVKIPIIGKQELEQFYIGTTRVIDPKFPSINVEEEYITQYLNGCRFLFLKFEKALVEGKVSHNENLLIEKRNYQEVDKLRISEIQWVKCNEEKITWNNNTYN